MSSRAERHQELAEAGIRAHQGLTTAHVERRAPAAGHASGGKPTTLRTPQLGERVIESGFSFGATESALKELQLYWQKIPDFGVKDAKVFSSETGWAQVLYWGGTTDDGLPVSAEEVDIVTTDEDFDIVRYEIYSDAKQWRDLLKIVHDGRLPSQSYDEMMAAQPGTA
jgi:hypothetical protein